MGKPTDPVRPFRSPRKVSLRASDRETARVVAVLGRGGEVVGAGCLLDGSAVLTCHHVVEAALGRKPLRGAALKVRLIGVGEQPTVGVRLVKVGGFARSSQSIDDLALLKFDAPMDIPSTEFATPLRHGGKRYSVLGFPDGIPQGRNASGVLHATDAAGLVQMDGNSALFVKGGFSGAPVWSEDLKAVVGLVVSEIFDAGVAWCVPSRLLGAFYGKLIVRFRIPVEDRPVVHDYGEDDPNVDLFGKVSNDGHRELTAKIKKMGGYYRVRATYARTQPGLPLRGSLVTFITYPDFRQDKEDAYELFSSIKQGKAEAEFYPSDLFTLAAIGDGGDTVLTLDLAECYRAKKREKAASRRG